MQRKDGKRMSILKRWSRTVAVSSMATAMMLSVTACSSYTPRDTPEHAVSTEIPTVGDPVPSTTESPQISAEEAQALLATVNCEAGVDPGDMSWRENLPRFEGTGIAAAANCLGDPLAVTLYDGDLAELASLLARPDDTTPLQEGWGCENYYDSQPNLWIVTTEGSLVQPRWPLDNCQHLLQPIPQEISQWPGDSPAVTPDAEQVAPPAEDALSPEEQPVYDAPVDEPVYDQPVEEPVSE